MRQNGLGKLYDRLTPEERFRLDVLAMARGDAEESELLTRTCPRYDYVMNDVAFARRWRAAAELAGITYMDLSGKVERLRLVEVFGYIIGAFAELVSLETEDEPPTGELHARAHALAREMPERTEDLERTIAEGGLAIWAAFKGFCAEEMGLEAEQLLGALVEPMLEVARELEKIAERLGVEPDPEIAAECTEALQENWQRQLGRG